MRRIERRVPAAHAAMARLAVLVLLVGTGTASDLAVPSARGTTTQAQALQPLTSRAATPSPWDVPPTSLAESRSPSGPATHAAAASPGAAAVTGASTTAPAPASPTEVAAPSPGTTTTKATSDGLGGDERAGADDIALAASQGTASETIRIDSPVDGAVLATRSVTVSGSATAPEGTLMWELTRTDGEVADSGFVPSGSNGAFGAFAVTVDVPAGDWVMSFWLPDYSDGEMSEVARQARKITTFRTTVPVPAPVSGGVLPFDRSGGVGSSGTLAFAHYFTPYPVSIDNRDPGVDYYARNYLSPQGEQGKHAAYGGLLRDRPLPRAPIGGSGWEDEDFEEEVRQARSAGLDGFTVDILSLSSHNWTRVIGLLEAANRVDPSFKVMLMPDMTTLGGHDPVTLAAKMAELSRYPAAFELGDGRLVVSPFKAENKSAQWWKSWLGTMKSRHGITVAFVPTFLDWRSHVAEFAPFSYGASHWGTANAPGSAGVAGAGQQIADLGLLYMAPVRVQDVRPNQGIFYEAGNTETLRSSWAGAIAGGAQWVQIPTWNDYSEGSSIAPSVGHGWSFLDISAYYLSLWKTGRAPHIVRDGLYLTHRSQSVAARPSTPQSTLMSVRGTPARDTVEALTFLTAPATVTVTVGSRTHTWQAPAGVSARTVPLGSGRITGSVVRGEQTTKATSPYEVTATPTVQDLQYHAVSSLR